MKTLLLPDLLWKYTNMSGERKIQNLIYLCSFLTQTPWRLEQPMQVVLPEADSLNAMLWNVAAMLGAQCLSNPLPCWDDRSVRGSILRHRKCLAKRETRYKTCKLALSRHMLHTPAFRTCIPTRWDTIHTLAQSVSLSFSLYFPAHSSYSQMRACSEEVRLVPYLWTADDFFML